MCQNKEELLAALKYVESTLDFIEQAGKHSAYGYAIFKNEHDLLVKRKEEINRQLEQEA